MKFKRITSIETKNLDVTKSAEVPWGGMVGSINDQADLIAYAQAMAEEIYETVDPLYLALEGRGDPQDVTGDINVDGLINGLTLQSVDVGFELAGGGTLATLSIDLTTSLSGLIDNLIPKPDPIDTGWDITNFTPTKTFNAAGEFTVTTLGDTLGTLIDILKTLGLISA